MFVSFLLNSSMFMLPSICFLSVWLCLIFFVFLLVVCACVFVCSGCTGVVRHFPDAEPSQSAHSVHRLHLPLPVHAATFPNVHFARRTLQVDQGKRRQSSADCSLYIATERLRNAVRDVSRVLCYHCAASEFAASANKCAEEGTIP